MAEAPPGQEDERVCRICRCEAEPAKPLKTPCRCTGSVGLVHDECVKAWLRQSGRNSCELCKETYRFFPIFPPGTPPFLPANEFAAAVGAYAWRHLGTGVHLLLAVICWGGFVPWAAAWTFRAAVHYRTMAGTGVYALRVGSWRYILQDWIVGVLLLLFMALSVSLNGGLHDFMRTESALLTARLAKQERVRGEMVRLLSEGAALRPGATDTRLTRLRQGLARQWRAVAGAFAFLRVGLASVRGVGAAPAAVTATPSPADPGAAGYPFTAAVVDAGSDVQAARQRLARAGVLRARERAREVEESATLPPDLPPPYYGDEHILSWLGGWWVLTRGVPRGIIAHNVYLLLLEAFYGKVSRHEAVHYVCAAGAEGCEKALAVLGGYRAAWPASFTAAIAIAIFGVFVSVGFVGIVTRGLASSIPFRELLEPTEREPFLVAVAAVRLRRARGITHRFLLGTLIALTGASFLIRRTRVGSSAVMEAIALAVDPQLPLYAAIDAADASVWSGVEVSSWNRQPVKLEWRFGAEGSQLRFITTLIAADNQWWPFNPVAVVALVSPPAPPEDGDSLADVLYREVTIAAASSSGIQQLPSPWDAREAASSMSAARWAAAGDLHATLPPSVAWPDLATHALPLATRAQIISAYLDYTCMGFSLAWLVMTAVMWNLPKGEPSVVELTRRLLMRAGEVHAREDRRRQALLAEQQVVRDAEQAATAEAQKKAVAEAIWQGRLAAAAAGWPTTSPTLEDSRPAIRKALAHIALEQGVVQGAGQSTGMPELIRRSAAQSLAVGRPLSSEEDAAVLAEIARLGKCEVIGDMVGVVVVPDPEGAIALIEGRESASSAFFLRARIAILRRRSGPLYPPAASVAGSLHTAQAAWDAAYAAETQDHPGGGVAVRMRRTGPDPTAEQAEALRKRWLARYGPPAPVDPAAGVGFLLPLPSTAAGPRSGRFPDGTLWMRVLEAELRPFVAAAPEATAALQGPERRAPASPRAAPQEQFGGGGHIDFSRVGGIMGVESGRRRKRGKKGRPDRPPPPPPAAAPRDETDEARRLENRLAAMLVEAADEEQEFVAAFGGDEIGIPPLLEEQEGGNIDLAQALGLPPHLLGDLVIHLLFGLALMVGGMALFVALPILSARSSLLFLRSKAPGAWTSLLWDTSSFHWHSNPGPRDFPLQVTDILLLVYGYSGVLYCAVVAWAVDVLSRVVGRMYIAARRAAVFLLMMPADCEDSVAANRAFVVHTSRLGAWEKALLPSAVASAIALALPMGEVRGVIDSLPLGRSVLIGARAVCMLVLRLGLLPLFAGVVVDVASLPLVGGGFISRLQWLYFHPLPFMVTHWLHGVTFLIVAFAVLLQLRERVAYRFLASWTYPDRPQSLGTVLRRRVHTQVLSCLVTCVVVVLLAFLFVWVPSIAVAGRLQAKAGNATAVLPAPLHSLSSAFLTSLSSGTYVKGSMVVTSALCVPKDGNATSPALPDAAPAVTQPLRPSCPPTHTLALVAHVRMVADEPHGGMRLGEALHRDDSEDANLPPWPDGLKAVPRKRRSRSEAGSPSAERVPRPSALQRLLNRLMLLHSAVQSAIVYVLDALVMVAIDTVALVAAAPRLLTSPDRWGEMSGLLSGIRTGSPSAPPYLVVEGGGTPVLRRAAVSVQLDHLTIYEGSAEFEALAPHVWAALGRRWGTIDALQRGREMYLPIAEDGVAWHEHGWHGPWAVSWSDGRKAPLNASCAPRHSDGSLPSSFFGAPAMAFCPAPRPPRVPAPLLVPISRGVYDPGFWTFPHYPSSPLQAEVRAWMEAEADVVEDVRGWALALVAPMCGRREGAARANMTADILRFTNVTENLFTLLHACLPEKRALVALVEQRVQEQWRGDNKVELRSQLEAFRRAANALERGLAKNGKNDSDWERAFWGSAEHLAEMLWRDTGRREWKGVLDILKKRMPEEDVVHRKSEGAHQSYDRAVEGGGEPTELLESQRQGDLITADIEYERVPCNAADRAAQLAAMPAGLPPSFYHVDCKANRDAGILLPTWQRANRGPSVGVEELDGPRGHYSLQWRVMPVFHFSAAAAGGLGAQGGSMRERSSGSLHSFLLRSAGGVYLPALFASPGVAPTYPPVYVPEWEEREMGSGNAGVRVVGGPGLSPAAAWWLPSGAGQTTVEEVTAWWVPAGREAGGRAYGYESGDEPGVPSGFPMRRASAAKATPAAGEAAEVFPVSHADEVDTAPPPVPAPAPIKLGTILRDGPGAGLRVCVAMNETEEEWRAGAGGTGRVNDGHGREQGGQETRREYHSIHFASGPGRETVLLDCGVTPAPAETFAFALPPPGATPVLHLTAPSHGVNVTNGPFRASYSYSPWSAPLEALLVLFLANLLLDSLKNAASVVQNLGLTGLACALGIAREILPTREELVLHAEATPRETSLWSPDQGVPRPLTSAQPSSRLVPPSSTHTVVSWRHVDTTPAVGKAPFLDRPGWVRSDNATQRVPDPTDLLRTAMPAPPPPAAAPEFVDLFPLPLVPGLVPHVAPARVGGRTPAGARASGPLPLPLLLLDNDVERAEAGLNFLLSLGAAVGWDLAAVATRVAAVAVRPGSDVWREKEGILRVARGALPSGAQIGPIAGAEEEEEGEEVEGGRIPPHPHELPPGDRTPGPFSPHALASRARLAALWASPTPDAALRELLTGQEEDADGTIAEASIRLRLALQAGRFGRTSRRRLRAFAAEVLRDVVMGVAPEGEVPAPIVWPSSSHAWCVPASVALASGRVGLPSSLWQVVVERRIVRAGGAPTHVSVAVSAQEWLRTVGAEEGTGWEGHRVPLARPSPPPPLPTLSLTADPLACDLMSFLATEAGLDRLSAETLRAARAAHADGAYDVDAAAAGTLPRDRRAALAERGIALPPIPRRGGRGGRRERTLLPPGASLSPYLTRPVVIPVIIFRPSAPYLALERDTGKPRGAGSGYAPGQDLWAPVNGSPRHVPGLDGFWAPQCGTCGASGEEGGAYRGLRRGGGGEWLCADCEEEGVRLLALGEESLALALFLESRAVAPAGAQLQGRQLIMLIPSASPAPLPRSSQGRDGEDAPPLDPLTFALRTAFFLATSLIITWAAVAGVLAGSLTLGRACQAALTLSPTHDPSALALGAPLAFLLLDGAFLAYFMLLNAAGGLAKRAAIACAATAGVVEERWDATGGKGAVWAAPSGTRIPPPGAATTLFDLAVGGRGGRVGAAVRAWTVRHVLLPAWQIGARDAMRSGGGYKLPGGLTRTRLRGVFTTLLAPAILAALLGTAWAALVDPMAVGRWLLAAALRVAGPPPVDPFVVALLRTPSGAPSASPASSVATAWTGGLLILALLLELAFSGLLGEDVRSFATLLEWRLVGLALTRFEAGLMRVLQRVALAAAAAVIAAAAVGLLPLLVWSASFLALTGHAADPATVPALMVACAGAARTAVAGSLLATLGRQAWRAIAASATAAAIRRVVRGWAEALRVQRYATGETLAAWARTRRA